eukprot:m.598567 g.598567  ORF g.598567 m.598567 type:complete len:146 (-) comp22422_c0_seq6:1798-2235(-)
MGATSEAHRRMSAHESTGAHQSLVAINIVDVRGCFFPNLALEKEVFTRLSRAMLPMVGALHAVKAIQWATISTEHTRITDTHFLYKIHCSVRGRAVRQGSKPWYLGTTGTSSSAISEAVGVVCISSASSLYPFDPVPLVRRPHNL